MRNATEITIIGNLTADPELRFTPSGAAVANFSVVVNTRRFDKQTQQWADAEPTFWRCTLWRAPAENAAESLTRGMRVIVTGRIETRTWADRTTGDKRTTTEIQVDEIGASLAFATVRVTKTDRSSGTTAPGGAGGAEEDEPPF